MTYRDADRKLLAAAAHLMKAAIGDSQAYAMTRTSTDDAIRSEIINDLVRQRVEVPDGLHVSTMISSVVRHWIDDCIEREAGHD
jgi:hypothetical protein